MSATPPESDTCSGGYLTDSGACRTLHPYFSICQTEILTKRDDFRISSVTSDFSLFLIPVDNHPQGEWACFVSFWIGFYGIVHTNIYTVVPGLHASNIHEWAPQDLVRTLSDTLLTPFGGKRKQDVYCHHLGIHICKHKMLYTRAGHDCRFVT